MWCHRPNEGFWVCLQAGSGCIGVNAWGQTEGALHAAHPLWWPPPPHSVCTGLDLGCALQRSGLGCTLHACRLWTVRIRLQAIIPEGHLVGHYMQYVACVASLCCGQCSQCQVQPTYRTGSTCGMWHQSETHRPDHAASWARSSWYTICLIPLLL